jgi:hypothetical protein
VGGGKSIARPQCCPSNDHNSRFVIRIESLRYLHTEKGHHKESPASTPLHGIRSDQQTVDHQSKICDIFHVQHVFHARSLGKQILMGKLHAVESQPEEEVTQWKFSRHGLVRCQKCKWYTVALGLASCKRHSRWSHRKQSRCVNNHSHEFYY